MNITITVFLEKVLQSQKKMQSTNFNFCIFLETRLLLEKQVM